MMVSLEQEAHPFSIYTFIIILWLKSENIVRFSLFWHTLSPSICLFRCATSFVIEQMEHNPTDGTSVTSTS